MVSPDREPGSVARFEPGRTILRRYFRSLPDGSDTMTFLNIARVIADDDRGLRIWYPAGTRYWRITDDSGRTTHDTEVTDISVPGLAELTWSRSDILVFMPPGVAHSVWWFFAAESADGGSRLTPRSGAGIFQGWYGNLETPYTRWDDGDVCGVDISDQALDLRIAPDGRWAWKDEDEFATRIGRSGYWTAAEAGEIRAEGERLATLAESRAFPFDGTWCDLVPDPTWAIPQRPDNGWDRPRVR
jgi:Protein of unknown function (DUF402)